MAPTLTLMDASPAGRAATLFAEDARHDFREALRYAGECTSALDETHDVALALFRGDRETVARHVRTSAMLEAFDLLADAPDWTGDAALDAMAAVIPCSPRFTAEAVSYMAAVIAEADAERHARRAAISQATSVFGAIAADPNINPALRAMFGRAA